MSKAENREPTKVSIDARRRVDEILSREKQGVWIRVFPIANTDTLSMDVFPTEDAARAIAEKSGGIVGEVDAASFLTMLDFINGVRSDKPQGEVQVKNIRRYPIVITVPDFGDGE